MEGSARQAAVHGLSASAILEVAEGLRWTDPALSVALAEHVARSAGDDSAARSAAERSAVLALGQSDRAAALILRAVPHLRAAERDGRSADVAVLRCELALAAVRCEEVDAAEALLEPLAAGQVLPAAVRADALVAWAAARAMRGDVPGVDAAARQVEDLVGTPTGDVRRVAVQRSRARARRVAGDATDALAVLRNATMGELGVDGGREPAMLVADRVELLAELGRGDEAREVGESSLAATPQATTALAVGRVRCALARLVSLPAGDVDTAARLAREAETDLLARGHEAQAAEAIEVLAEVAAQRGESRHALEELRRAHAHATAAREETTRAQIALAVALARTETPSADPDHALDPSEATEDARPDLRPEAGPDPDPLAGVRASLAALGSPVELGGPRDPGGPGEGSPADEGGSSADALGAALPAATSGSFEGLGWTRVAVAGPASDDPPAPAPGIGEGNTPEPASRRRRYRDAEEPGDALAAALAAAREGSLDAFATSTPAPIASDVEPPMPDHEPGALHSDAAGGTAEEARNRRLARARARWEASDSLLPRRSDPTPEPDEAMPGPPDERDAEGARPSDRGSGRPVDGDTERHRHRRGHREGPGVGSVPGDPGRPTSGRPGAEVGGLAGGPAGRAEVGVDDRRPSRNGHGLVGGGQVVRDGGHAHDGTTGNGHRDRGWTGAGGRRENGNHRERRYDEDRREDRRENGRDVLRGEDRDDEPATVAARWGGAPGIASAGATAAADVDDEYRRELALTLVDLLSEYQDAAPKAEAPSPMTSRIQGRPTATTGDGRTRSPASGSTRTGVPSARQADDSGPRLADLLAEAMDAYHSAGPGTTSGDGGRARR